MFGDIGKMMRLAGEMKRRMPEVQARLAAATHEAQAGGGAVSACVNGKLQLTGLKINPQLLAEGDVTMIEDLVKAAVSAAQQRATDAAAQAMKELTGGMDIPGLGGLTP